jgi:integrase
LGGDERQGYDGEAFANGLGQQTKCQEMHFLTAAQVEALADAITPPYGVLIRFAAYTGPRPCEFVALKVGRLDLLRGMARVAEPSRTCQSAA